MFSFSYQRATQLRVYARRRLVSWGILKKLKFPKAEEAFATFILSSSGGIFYRGPLNHKEDGSVEATFVIDNAAIFPEAGKVTYDKFVAIVDVENKVLISAHYGSVKLSPEDALLMILNELYTHVHPQLHAWANYGVSVCSPHWFVARMSKVTVAYNYKGSDGAPKHLEINHQMGLADKCNGKTYIGKKGYKHGEVRTGFLARIQEHSPTHRDIYDLAPYSPFIDFVIKIRTFFMEEFKKYADNDFVGIHPEGLFLATIMHSLDHEMAFLIDVHRLEAENEMLRGVEEHMIAFHHLADGCHWFPFAYRFKDAPHPFYQSVYEFAHKLNPKLAEDLDACIIR